MCATAFYVEVSQTGFETVPYDGDSGGEEWLDDASDDKSLSLSLSESSESLESDGSESESEEEDSSSRRARRCSMISRGAFWQEHIH